jgi:hypothetical protein
MCAKGIPRDVHAQRLTIRDGHGEATAQGWQHGARAAPFYGLQNQLV